MQTVRRLFRQATWLAIFAMLGLALAPTVSHALAASGPGNPWTEVCTVTGGRLALVDAFDMSDSQGAGGTHLGHCPLCGHLGDTPAMPPPQAAGAPIVDGADVRPALFALAPSAQFSWAAAQPRAPPAFS